MISIIQADGLYELEKGINYGNKKDFFIPDEISANLTSIFKWWDGNSSNLNISKISSDNKNILLDFEIN